MRNKNGFTVRYQNWYTFIDTEEEAKEFCEKEDAGNTPYHDDLDDLYDWPEFKISFEDYFNAISEADTSEEEDNIRESLKGKVDFSVKSIADYQVEITDKMRGLKDYMSYVIGTLNNLVSNDENTFTFMDGAASEYHKAYQDYTDLDYRLRELKEIA